MRLKKRVYVYSIRLVVFFKNSQFPLKTVKINYATVKHLSGSFSKIPKEKEEEEEDDASSMQYPHFHFPLDVAAESNGEKIGEIVADTEGKRWRGFE